jgi:hypothetical protein
MEAMATVTLRIEPELCGPMSIGTVAVVKLVAEHFALGFSTAIAYVDRCVFEGQGVDIPAQSLTAAERFVVAVQALPRVPRVVASVIPHK